MSRVPWIVFCVGALVMAAGAADAREVDFGVMEAKLREPHVLETSGGRNFTGFARMPGEDAIVITSGDGRIEYSFSLDEVVRLRLPGDEYYPVARELEETGEYTRALRLMDALYRSRARYLPLLGPGELRFLLRFADLNLREGDPFLAVAVGRNLLPHVEDPDTRRQVEDLILLGHYSLPIKERAVELSWEWIKQNEPDGDSALGYYVYGQLAYDRGEYETALVTALQPIAFSSQFPMDYLAHCYALAVMAWEAMGRTAKRETLAMEMKERGFDWPSLAMLAPYEHLYPRKSDDHELEE